MNDKIIQFPGSGRHVKKPDAVEVKAAEPSPEPAPTDEQLVQAATDPADPNGEKVAMVMQRPDGTTVEMTPAQQKAFQLLVSGMTFVMVGIRPGPTGADFFTAIHGDHTDLRNAQDHLPDIINRAYGREGIS